MTRSPWWYRNRAFTIGMLYFSGFFFGPLVSQLVRLRPAPIFVQASFFYGREASRALLVGAILMTIVCWLLRLWGGAYLRPEVVWNAEALDDRLIVDGPFRFVRNPLYLGNVFLALAMSVFATPIGAVFIVAGNLVLIAGFVRVEQRLLRAKYGAAFEAYANAVSAIVPRLRPYSTTADATAEPSYALGFRSELFSGAFVIATIVATAYFW